MAGGSVSRKPSDCDKPDCEILSVPSGSRAGLVPSEDLRGRSRGASQDSPDAVLLQTLQGPGTPPPSRQHLLRLQGQPGNLPAGLSDFLLLLCLRVFLGVTFKNLAGVFSRQACY